MALMGRAHSFTMLHEIHFVESCVKHPKFLVLSSHGPMQNNSPEMVMRYFAVVSFYFVPATIHRSVPCFVVPPAFVAFETRRT
jgi:hypothetical protein